MTRKYLLTGIFGLMELAFTSCDQKMTQEYCSSTTLKCHKTRNCRKSRGRKSHSGPDGLEVRTETCLSNECQ